MTIHQLCNLCWSNYINFNDLHENHANRDLHEFHANRFHQYVFYEFLCEELANRDLHDFHANRDLQMQGDLQAFFVT